MKDFIYQKKIIDLFKNGYCYYFSLILKERFKGTILYDLIDGHFVTQIGEDIFDIRGCITDKYCESNLYDESVWSNIPSIIHGCILKDNWEFE